MNTTFTELDKTFLNHVGGVNRNSFVQILDFDEDDLNQPQIIHHSSYYDIDKLTSTLNRNKNKFSICSTNIQFIHAKIDELIIFVKSLNKIKYAFSAICIQESWLSEDDDTSQIQLDDSECITQGKLCSSKGGLIIYLHERVKYVPKLKLNKYQTWEGQVIQIKRVIL